MYPGCIAESPLFREKRAWFRKYFPVFMKFITGTLREFCAAIYLGKILCVRAHVSHTSTFSSFLGGFVGEHEAGQRLFQVAHDPRCSKSGVYWSWNGGPREGRGTEALEKGGQISGGGGAGGGWDSIFENDQSAKVLDIETAVNLFRYATEVTGAEWPDIKAVTSPCPTLKVIGAVTKGMVKREELKRIREMGRPGMEQEAEPVKVGVTKKAVVAADRVVTGVLSNTVGRAARFAGKRILGEFPDEALNGSFDAPQDGIRVLEEGMTMVNAEVTPQINKAPISDEEDEELFRQIFRDQDASRPVSERVLA
jgi:hypothetical protein